MRARKLLALASALLALGLVAGCGSDDEGGDSGSQESSSSSESGGGTIKVAFLSDCEGTFGSFFEPTISGFNQALIDKAGAKAAGEKPSDGIEGATVAGKKIEIVGYGCAQRDGRQGDRGDAPADGAGGRGHPRRPAVG